VQAIKLDARRTKAGVSHAAGGHHVNHYSTRFKVRVWFARNSRLLLLVIFVLARALVRVENERYSLWLGMCPNMSETFAATRAGNEDAWKCTKTIQTRTGWWWHLYYAVPNKD
jgi:hypothetical protein